jgi:hypothetical protein
LVFLKGEIQRILCNVLQIEEILFENGTLFTNANGLEAAFLEAA